MHAQHTQRPDRRVVGEPPAERVPDCCRTPADCRSEALRGDGFWGDVDGGSTQACGAGTGQTVAESGLDLPDRARIHRSVGRSAANRIGTRHARDVLRKLGPQCDGYPLAQDHPEGQGGTGAQCGAHFQESGDRVAVDHREQPTVHGVPGQQRGDHYCSGCHRSRTEIMSAFSTLWRCLYVEVCPSGQVTSQGHEASAEISGFSIVGTLSS